MTSLCSFYRSTIGKKLVVALTGIVLFGFVTGHMLGNLKAFTGVDAATGVHHLDIYAAHLRAFGEEMLGYRNFLWMTRAVLLISVVLHVITIIDLRRINKRAKPVGYRAGYEYHSLLPARAMMWSGVFLALFIVYHLLHLTFGIAHTGDFHEGRVYANVFYAFQNFAIVGIYVAAVFCLGLHLFHGVWSLFQTLGIDNPDRNGALRAFAKVMAVVLFFGFSAVPVAFGLGLMPPPSTHYVEMK